MIIAKRFVSTLDIEVDFIAFMDMYLRNEDLAKEIKHIGIVVYLTIISYEYTSKQMFCVV